MYDVVAAKAFAETSVRRNQRVCGMAAAASVVLALSAKVALNGEALLKRKYKRK